MQFFFEMIQVVFGIIAAILIFALGYQIYLFANVLGDPSNSWKEYAPQLAMLIKIWVLLLGSMLISRLASIMED